MEMIKLGIWKCRECGKIQEGSNFVTNGKCKYCKKYYALIRHDPNDKELNENQRKEKLFKIRNSILISILVITNLPIIYFQIKYPGNEITFQLIFYILFEFLGFSLIGLALIDRKKKVDLIKLKEKLRYIKYCRKDSIGIGFFCIFGWLINISLIYLKYLYIGIFIEVFSWITLTFTIFLSIMFVIFLNSDISRIRKGLERKNRRKITQVLNKSFLNFQDIFEKEIEMHLHERKCSFCQSNMHFFSIFDNIKNQAKMEDFLKHWNDESIMIFCNECIWENIPENLMKFSFEKKWKESFKVLPYQVINDDSIKKLLEEHGFFMVDKK